MTYANKMELLNAAIKEGFETLNPSPKSPVKLTPESKVKLAFPLMMKTIIREGKEIKFLKVIVDGKEGWAGLHTLKLQGHLDCVLD